MPLVEIDLGGEHDFIARGVAPDRSAEVLFARAGGIGVRRIEKVDAEIERAFDDSFALFGIERPGVHLACGIAETHTPQAQTRDADPAVSKRCILHILPPGSVSACLAEACKRVQCTRIADIRQHLKDELFEHLRAVPHPEVRRGMARELRLAAALRRQDAEGDRLALRVGEPCAHIIIAETVRGEETVDPAGEFVA